MILLVDNYDSFTYNLYQYLGELTLDILVQRRDAIHLKNEDALKGIVISPGPSSPESVPDTLAIIRKFYKKVPILGVCLGHQCIGFAFGAKIVQAKRIMHGKTSQITHDGSVLFEGIPSPFEAGRYHSLVIEKSSLPDSFKITATSEDGEVMGIAHKTHPLFGIQFHPESILTPFGKKLLENFVRLLK